VNNGAEFQSCFEEYSGGDSLVQQLKIIFPTVGVGNVVNVTNSDRLMVFGISSSEISIVSSISSERPVVSSILSERPVVSSISSERPVVSSISSERPVVSDISSERPLMSGVATRNAKPLSHVDIGVIPPDSHQSEAIKRKDSITIKVINPSKKRESKTYMLNVCIDTIGNLKHLHEEILGTTVVSFDLTFDVGYFVASSRKICFVNTDSIKMELT